MVKLDLPDNFEGLHLFSDRELLQKVLCHLLDNAHKFTTEGAIIFGYRCSTDEISFFVSDTGCGIAADKLEAIFDVFIQEDTAISRGYEGSGLGLAIHPDQSRQYLLLVFRPQSLLRNCVLIFL